MGLPVFHYNPQQEPPLSIFIEHLDTTRDGHWRPSAFIKLNDKLRTSGFWGALPPEEFKNFFLLLTFLGSNGQHAPTVAHLADAIRLSEAKTRARFERLAEVRWHSQPIVLPVPGEGLTAFMPVHGLLPVVEEAAQEQHPPAIQAAPRSVIIEHSRRTYGRPRAEAERQIAEQLGHESPERTPAPTEAARQSDDPQTALKGELMAVGIEPNQADELLVRFDPIRIRRQLAWLSFRPVRNRAGFLIAAIKDDYEAPRGMQRLSNDSSSEAAA